MFLNENENRLLIIFTIPNKMTAMAGNLARVAMHKHARASMTSQPNSQWKP